LYLTIFPSLIGCKNSVIKFTMDTIFFNFIAKISFCTYLIHLTLVQIWVNSRTYSRYYTNIPIFVEYCGLLIICLVSGLIMTFMIEVPFSKIQKMLIGSIKNKFTSVK
jgi:peptidoglycan/LPS O-acetylase OafA/YrhL